MEIKPMLFREFETLDTAEQERYLQAIVDRFGAVKLNLCEMLDMSVYGYQKYVKEKGIKIKYRSGKKSYTRCANSEEWIAFTLPLSETMTKRRSIEAKEANWDCFAYDPPKGRSHGKCNALKKLYCSEGDCGFYKNKLAYMKENRRIYGNPQGIDLKYQKKLEERWKK